MTIHNNTYDNQIHWRTRTPPLPAAVGSEADCVLLSDPDLSSKTVDMQIAALDPAPNRLGRNVDLFGEGADGEELRQAGRRLGHGCGVLGIEGLGGVRGMAAGEVEAS